METEKLKITIEELISSLQKLTFEPNYRTTIGFDGFVDEIIDVVDKRHSGSDYTKIATIKDLGERILRSANLSTNIELVPKLVKLGGNGPILANALAATGQRVSYLGALGTPDIDPAFADFAASCEHVISFANPAHTDALEFNDGKIMLGKLESLNEITWENLTRQIDSQLLRKLLTEVDLVATVNWTMTPYLNDLWKKMQDFLAETEMQKKPILFVDLADPQKHSDEEIGLALKLLQQFSAYYRVVFGLNRKEASAVARALGLDNQVSYEQLSLSEVTNLVAKNLDLWCVVVHAVKGAAALLDNQLVELAGPYCSQPKITTGAGDNFNAGFCLGLLLELPLAEILALASGSSGFYVRHGYSPSFAQLQEFVVLWLNNINEDF